MVKELNSIDGFEEYITEVDSDPIFHHPMLALNENIGKYLANEIKKPKDHVFGVFNDKHIIGVFAFLILEEEKYMELTAAVSRDEAAYREVFDYLQSVYLGFQADFVYNPKNILLVNLLKQKDALFFTEQQKMNLIDSELKVDTSGIEPLSENNQSGYLAMHSRDLYWTGERVLAAPERFSSYVALEDGKTVGYLDITNCHDENEIFDVMVKEEYRRRGWGRKLLAKAIEKNRPKKMILTVDVDNIPAIRLYEGLGFVKEEGQNSQTAVWKIDN